MNRVRYISLLLAFLLSSIAYGQSFNVRADLDSVAILIGEQSKLSYSISQSPNSFVEFPIYSDTIVSGLEIVERLKRDTFVHSDNNIEVVQSYIVTSFDSMLIYIPSQIFIGEGDTLLSNALSLKVLSMPIDTTQQSITDIKDVYSAPFDWNSFAMWLLIVFVVIVLIVLGFYLFKRYYHKGKDGEIGEIIDPRLAHEIAFERLESLKSEHLCEKGKIKEYYTELTDILRLYLSKRYGVSAQELTSGEILNLIKTNHFVTDPICYGYLKDVLHLSDLVKFAKWSPLPNENDKSFNEVYDFIEQTKEEPISEIENEKQSKEVTSTE